MSDPVHDFNAFSVDQATLEISQSLGKLASQPESSLNSLSKNIADIIGGLPGVVLAAIFIKPEDSDYLSLSGYYSDKPISLAKPLHFKFSDHWFSKNQSLMLDSNTINAQAAAKFLDWSIDRLEHNDQKLGVETILVICLKSRGHFVGIIAVGFNYATQSSDPAVAVINTVQGLIAAQLSGLIAEQNSHYYKKRLNDYSHKMTALDEIKDDFISMASHQLRTPLTSVKGYISMILEGDAGNINHDQKVMLTQAFASCQRMVYIISDLLNVSRLNSGKFVMSLTPVNLDEIVQDEIDQLSEIAKAHSVGINYEAKPNLPLLNLDETKIRQVIMNFIDNALYYTPAGGAIDISLNNKASAIELRVKDNGIGVPRSEQRHLFTKFYRASNARKTRPDGTGLGLFMAKKVIISLGGAIIFEGHEGKGSTFGFIFPKH